MARRPFYWVKPLAAAALAIAIDRTAEKAAGDCADNGASCAMRDCAAQNCAANAADDQAGGAV